MEKNKRLNILTPEEIHDLYGLPLFTNDEREIYFAMNEQERQLFDTYRSNAKAHFLLQLGQFKAKRIFFSYNNADVKDDLAYIIDRYFKDQKIDLTRVSESTLKQQRHSILKLHSYRFISSTFFQRLEEHIAHAVKISIKAAFLFKEALNFIEHERLVLPSYQSMQDIIGKGIAKEYRRIEQRIADSIPKVVGKELEKLLSDSETIHDLTIIKKDAKDFSFGEVKKELRKRDKLERLYRFSCKLIPALGISSINIQYYASLIDYYTVAQLKNLAPSRSKLYLLCYVHIRFQKVNDNLIKTFTYLIKNYKEQGKIAAKERMLEYKITISENMKRAGEVWGLFTDDKISDATQFGKVRKLAFKILKKDEFPVIQSFIQDSSFDKEKIEWEEWEKLAAKFKRNVRQIITQLCFESESPKDPILRALNAIKKAILDGNSLNSVSASLPIDILPDGIRPYILQRIPGKGMRLFLNADRYEFFVYDQVKDLIESGDIFCQDSVEYKSFASDLIKKNEWKKNRAAFLNDNGLSQLNVDADRFLDALEDELESAYQHVNERIRSKGNQHIIVKSHGKWSLPYQKVYEDGNQIFSAIPQIFVNDLLNFVNERTKFSTAFTHITGRKQSSPPDTPSIFAAIIALGTNFGLSKMSSISDMPLGMMRSAAASLIRLDTLKNANDMVINEIAKLRSFLLYHISDNKIHSGSDGQKFETHSHTVKSRYSPKYFGLNKGIVCYTLVADHIPINAKIIGANEHESHFVFDILASNTSDIKPEIHSTDTHGVNNANFFILDCFGYQFAPRYRNIFGKAENSLVGFSDTKSYAGHIVRPSRKVDLDLIKSEWDNIKRIIASLAVKETTQNILVKKLCSYKGQNRTKLALWEVDSILESLYILQYIDDVGVRRNVQKALNRVESYHGLRKAIAVAHQGSSKAKTEMDLSIWNECSRLLANAVIYFNHLILSQLIESSPNQQKAIKLVQKCSPVAWSHINFYGWYQFGKIEPINMDKIVKSLEIEEK